MPAAVLLGELRGGGQRIARRPFPRRRLWDGGGGDPGGGGGCDGEVVCLEN